MSAARRHPLSFCRFSNSRSCSIYKKWQQVGSQIKKGDELGIFQFGGSSIIVAFQRGRIKFDEDLLGLSRQRVQVAVEVDMSLGTAVDPSA